MAAPVTTSSVWNALADNLFAVLAWVAPDGSARSAGIVYVVRGRRLHVGTSPGSWKARHIRANGSVSVTATLPRRIPLLPWIRMPAATVTFRADADVVPLEHADPGIVTALTEGMADAEAMRADMCLISLTPRGDFLTYGIDVSLRDMMDPEKARGRAPA
jgi:hypothetical protein